MAGNKKISELDQASTLVGSEQAELLQVGKSVRVSLDTIGTYFDTAKTSLQFTPQVTPPTYAEGLIYYDDTKKALTYFNDSSEVAVNLGQEIYFIVENQTGGLLSNGTVVSPDETTVITKANAYSKDKSRVIAVLTEDIADGETGYATKLGQVGGLDTSTFSTGQIVYLGDDGDFVAGTPTDGGYVCIVGVVDVVDATEGVITVDTKTSDTTVEVTDTNGFPPEQRTGTTISFVDGTRTFTIAPTGTDFHFYELGDKYEKTGSENIVIADTTGGHIIYYDGGVLSEIVNPTSSQGEDIILNHAIVAYIYWNTSTAKGEIVQDERHGLMQPVVHVYLHQRFGAFYLSGLALGDFVIGNGSLNSHAQFSIATGVIKDEDIAHTLNTIVSTTGLKYYYRSGANGDYVSGTNAGYSFPVGATPLPQYNQYTGATWQLTEVTSGNYMNLHIFANGAIDGNPICLLGTSQYTQLSAASAGQADELSSILGNLPLPEFVLIGTVIIEAKTAFTNSVNARVVQNSNGENYTNWTVTELAVGASPTNHNNLAGLEAAGTGVTWGHIDDQIQNIYGYKGFENSATPLAAIDVGDGEYYRTTFSTQADNQIYPILISRLVNQTNNFGVGIWRKVYLISNNSYGLVFKVKKGSAAEVESLEIDSDSNIIIPVTPATATVTHPVLYRNSSTGAIEQFTQLKQTSVASSATPTPTGDARENEYYLTALAVGATFASPSGTPANGNTLIIRIKDNGTARSLAYNAIYRAIGVTLPTTTVISKTLYLGFIYNSDDSKWDCVSVVQEA